jgi:transmembrane sensor
MFTPWRNRQAAEHFLALQDSEAHPDAIAAALSWLEQSEANRREFERVQRFWDACEDVSTFVPSANLSADGSSGVWKISAALLVAASVSAALIGVVHHYGLFQPAPRAMSYASAVGETRVLHLPDRSEIVLGGASAITVRFDNDARNIVLNDGEALFNVAHDRHRPFLVNSGAGSIRAVGTSFNVHRGYAGTTVTVVHGAVEVKSRTPKVAASNVLRPGMQLSYGIDGKMAEPRRVDAAKVVSWQTGVLRYTGEPLTVVVADLNRYSLRPILIDSPQVGLVEITGTVRTDGIADWLSGLASAAGLEIIDNDPGVIRLRMRAGRDVPVKKFPARLPATTTS